MKHTKKRIIFITALLGMLILQGCGKQQGDVSMVGKDANLNNKNVKVSDNKNSTNLNQQTKDVNLEENLDNNSSTQIEDESDIDSSSENSESLSNSNSNSNSNENCSKQYENLLAKYGKNFDDCLIKAKTANGCDKSAGGNAKRKNLVVIFDSSGSMAAMISGKKKIDIAKNSVFSFFRDIDKNTNLSIVLYGHKGNNTQAGKAASCAGIEEVYYMGPVNSEIAISKLAGTKPTGWTPIAASFQKAKEILSKYPADKNDNMVLLVSDGEETCGGDPVAKAKEMFRTNAKIVTNVIGFDVAGEEEKKLQNISKGGGGKFFSVHNEKEFKAALKENKNYMLDFDCYMNQSDVWLDNGQNVEFKRDECIERLESDERLEIEMMANTLSGGVTEKCKQFVLSSYNKRYNQIKLDIEKAYSAGKNSAKNEQDKLDKIKEGLKDDSDDVFDPQSDDSESSNFDDDSDM